MLNHRIKIAFSIIWAVLLAGAGFAWVQSGLEAAQVPAAIDAWLTDFGVARAALLYIIFYTLRPLVFFPATFLTVASGMIFGPWLGIAFTVIGENASANFAFALARWLGRDWVSDHEHGRVRQWDARIRENALVSVLVMRLIYLPFDVVNYGCGLTGMRQRDFFLGTLIGIMPGLVSFVLLGGSGAARAENRALLLGSAITFFFLGLLIAHVLRRTESLPPRA